LAVNILTVLLDVLSSVSWCLNKTPADVSCELHVQDQKLPKSVAQSFSREDYFLSYSRHSSYFVKPRGLLRPQSYYLSLF